MPKAEVMNRKAVVEVLADSLGQSKAEADATLKATLSVISDALVSGKSVAISGFGTFNVAERAAGMRRNPATGEQISVPAKKVVKFKPYSTLKDAL